MKSDEFTWLILTAAMLLSNSSLVAQVSATPPSFPKMFVGRPQFTTKSGIRSAGSACLARFENNPQIYLLTVRHLLGPSGGFPELVPPDQVASFVSAIRFEHFFAPGSKLYQVDGMKVPEAPDAKSPLFNVMIFTTKMALTSDAAAVTLETPPLGETVWVVARVRAASPKDGDIHSAKVTSTQGRWLICDFDDSTIVPNGASGAPVLNKAGKIVGIYCTHSNREGKIVAYVIPSALIASVINAAKE